MPKIIAKSSTNRSRTSPAPRICKAERGGSKQARRGARKESRKFSPSAQEGVRRYRPILVEHLLIAATRPLAHCKVAPRPSARSIVPERGGFWRQSNVYRY